jgi:adenylate kinase
MRLVLTGPPGSGKGTQAMLLAERNNLCHFGMGDILREAIQHGTPAGREAAPFVQRGELVPDVVVNRLIGECFGRDDRPRRFVMDGYPRTVGQAVAFDQVLHNAELDLDRAVRLVVEDDEIVRRLSGRRTCPRCKATYHTISKPPRVPDICDNDGSVLVQRDDDREEIIRERLRVYHYNNADLLRYYRERGLLRDVPGEGGIETIYEDILRAVAGR